MADLTAELTPETIDAIERSVDGGGLSAGLILPWHVRRLIAMARETVKLRKERDEARDWVRRMHNETQVLTCAFCGEAYPPATPAANDSALAEHIRVCQKHPMRELRVRLTAWEERQATACPDGQSFEDTIDAMERHIVQVEGELNFYQKLDSELRGELAALLEVVTGQLYTIDPDWDLVHDTVGRAKKALSTPGGTATSSEAAEPSGDRRQETE